MRDAMRRTNVLVGQHLMIGIRSSVTRMRPAAASAYWRAESVRLRTGWWLQDEIILPVARLSAARWAAGRPVPAWWRAFLVVLLSRAED